MCWEASPRRPLWHGRWPSLVRSLFYTSVSWHAAGLFVSLRCMLGMCGSAGACCVEARASAGWQLARA